MFTLPQQEDKEYIIQQINNAIAVALHKFASSKDPLIIALTKALDEINSLPAES